MDLCNIYPPILGVIYMLLPIIGIMPTYIALLEMKPNVFTFLFLGIGMTSFLLPAFVALSRASC